MEGARAQVMAIRFPGAVLRLEPGASLLVGRSPGNDAVLEAPSAAPFHARLSWEPGDSTPRVRDQGSANGTRVGGRRLPPHVPIPVPAGARLALGEVAGWVVPAPPGWAALLAGVDPGQTLVAGRCGRLRELLLALERGLHDGTLTVDIAGAGLAGVELREGRARRAWVGARGGRDALRWLLHADPELRYLRFGPSRTIDLLRARDLGPAIDLRPGELLEMRPRSRTGAFTRPARQPVPVRA